jgi:hypothetical protein
MQNRRTVGLFGIVFVVFLVAALFVIPSPPAPGSSVTKVVQYVSAHQSAIQWNLALGVFAAFWYLLFTGGLVARVRRDDGEHDEAWGLPALLGAGGFVVVAMIGTAVEGALRLAVVEGHAASAVMEQFNAANTLSAVGGIFLAVFLLSMATTGIRHTSTPSWLCYLAVVSAALNLLGSGGVASTSRVFGTFGVIGTISFALWSLLTAIWLLVGAERRSVRSVMPSGDRAPAAI